MNTPSWFNVFDPDNHEWLQEDEHSWGPYNRAAEFFDYATAREVALREMKYSPKVSRSVVVLGDFGLVEPE